jgi:hypothetical protein
MINYTTAPASLKYPLEQITYSISNIDLGKLNSSPFEILPTGFNYNVVNAYLSYENSTLDPTQNLYIGYESLLGGVLTSCFCQFDTIYMNGNIGNIGLGTRIQNLGTPSNSANYEPLVLWQQADNTGATYTLFNLTVTYIKFP